MQIVIEIPEEAYNLLKTSGVDWLGAEHILDAVSNGTPLPKGHGRLKDTDAICKNIISALGIRNENCLLEAEKAIYKRITNASTIIEADKAEREESE